ncbi:MAG: carboxypeptidase-like regulatory domain-containing protein [Prolixibacteraceae bacterium]|nr:carboxypeptidase-like regulatory domain-containing protein [Prolixibacteraceae bacterium]
MKLISFIGFFAIIGFLFNPGAPVPGAKVYIEQSRNSPPVAFQQTGDNGKVTFSHLPSGTYWITVVLPAQRGKYIRGQHRIDCDLQVGYHQDKKDYYLQEDEGFFIINFSKLKKLQNRNVTPVYNVRYDKDEKLVEIGKFEVSGNNGSLTVSMRAQKPKKFEKLVKKVSSDASMSIIRNMR